MACPNGGKRCGKCESCHKRKLAARQRRKNERRTKRKLERKNGHSKPFKWRAAHAA